eukprot:9492840-Pyramimonas_sp.AAC.1
MPPPESNLIRKNDSGQQVPPWKSHGPPRTPKDHPLLVQATATRQARDAEQDPSVRHVLGIRLVELQHKLQAENHHLKHEYLLKRGRVDRSFRGGKVKVLKTAQGELITQVEEIREEVAQFYHGLFNDQSSLDETLPKWIWQQWPREAAANLPHQFDAALL